VALDGDADEEGRGQQHKGDMAIPAQVAADLIVIESEGFAGLQCTMVGRGVSGGAQSR
jgi:hypothetical protein